MNPIYTNYVTHNSQYIHTSQAFLSDATLALLNRNRTMINLYENNNRLENEKENNIIRTLFINNIPKDVPDSLMMIILEECGKVKNWKRIKKEENDLSRFGWVEFENIKGVLTCIRLLENYNLYNDKLEIKISDLTKSRISTYLNNKMDEYKNNYFKNENIKNEDLKKKVIENLEKDDWKIKEKINHYKKLFNIKKYKQDIEKEKQKEEEKYDKEIDKILRKKKRDLDNKFKKKLDSWLKNEKKYKENKEKEMYEKNNNHENKLHYLEKISRIDSEEEKYKTYKNVNLKEEKLYRKDKRKKE